MFLTRAGWEKKSLPTTSPPPPPSKLEESIFIESKALQCYVISNIFSEGYRSNNCFTAYSNVWILKNILSQDFKYLVLRLPAEERAD